MIRDFVCNKIDAGHGKIGKKLKPHFENVQHTFPSEYECNCRAF